MKSKHETFELLFAEQAVQSPTDEKCNGHPKRSRENNKIFPQSHYCYERHSRLEIAVRRHQRTNKGSEIVIQFYIKKRLSDLIAFSLLLIKKFTF